MSHLGILLLSPHYPKPDKGVEKLPSYIHEEMEKDGQKIDKISVFSFEEKAKKVTPETCDLWLLSGSNIDLDGEPHKDLAPFLHSARVKNIPLYALYHAEHALHDLMAVSKAEQPQTQRQIFCIRNPFFQLWKSDILHKFDPVTSAVTPTG